MNVVVLNVVLVLSIFIVAINASLTCDQLPKVQIPGIEVFVKNSPFRVHYALTPLFDCSSKVFTYPARGTTNYNGTALISRGILKIGLDYSVDSDGTTLHSTLPGIGLKTTWHLAAVDFNDNGGFFCLYTCFGPLILEFACDSNNNGTSSKIMETVKMAKKVANGFLIHDARKHCPPN